MGWDGDISRMGQLVANLGKLARVPAKASPVAAKRILDLIDEEFDTGTDPYGRAWAPLAAATLAKGRTPPPLTDKRNMRNSAHAVPLPGAGFGIVIDHPAQVHQTGGSNPATGWRMPARPILPSGTFPARWKDVIDDSIAEEINGTMQGAA